MNKCLLDKISAPCYYHRKLIKYEGNRAMQVSHYTLEIIKSNTDLVTVSVKYGKRVVMSSLLLLRSTYNKIVDNQDVTLLFAEIEATMCEYEGM